MNTDFGGSSRATKTTIKDRVIEMVVAALNSEEFLKNVLSHETEMEHKADALKELAAVIKAVKAIK